MRVAGQRGERRGIGSGFLIRAAASFLLAALFPWAVSGPVAAGVPEPNSELSLGAAKTAADKFQQVQEASLSGRSFGEIRISEIEANSYLRYELASSFPTGVSNARVEFQPNRPQGWAEVNFDQLKNRFPTASNSVVDYFLQGTHTLGVEGTFYSSNGMGRFDLETVTLDGITLPRSVVDFLMEHYLKTRYPNAAVDRPFRLPFSIDRISVETGSVLMVGKPEGS